MPANDVVIIVDAHDVLFFPCSRDIVEEYHKLGADIIFGADYNAFPDNYSASYYPPSPKNLTHGPAQQCAVAHATATSQPACEAPPKQPALTGPIVWYQTLHCLAATCTDHLILDRAFEEG